MLVIHGEGGSDGEDGATEPDIESILAAALTEALTGLHAPHLQQYDDVNAGGQAGAGAGAGDIVDLTWTHGLHPWNPFSSLEAHVVSVPAAAADGADGADGAGGAGGGELGQSQGQGQSKGATRQHDSPASTDTDTDADTDRDRDLSVMHYYYSSDPFASHDGPRGWGGAGNADSHWEARRAADLDAYSEAAAVVSWAAKRTLLFARAHEAVTEARLQLLRGKELERQIDSVLNIVHQGASGTTEGTATGGAPPAPPSHVGVFHSLSPALATSIASPCLSLASRLRSSVLFRLTQAIQDLTDGLVHDSSRRTLRQVLEGVEAAVREVNVARDALSRAERELGLITAGCRVYFDLDRGRADGPGAESGAGRGKGTGPGASSRTRTWGGAWAGSGAGSGAGNPSLSRALNGVAALGGVAVLAGLALVFLRVQFEVQRRAKKLE